MTAIPPAAVTAATEPILRRLPSLGPERCRTIATEALEAAAPHITAAAVDDYRQRVGALLQAVLERRSDAEFEERLKAVRLRHEGDTP